MEKSAHPTPYEAEFCGFFHNLGKLYKLRLLNICMETRVQKRTIRKKYKNYYINIPQPILKRAPWLKKRKVIDIDVDILLKHVIIKPR